MNVPQMLGDTNKLLLDRVRRAAPRAGQSVAIRLAHGKSRRVGLPLQEVMGQTKTGQSLLTIGQFGNLVAGAGFEPTTFGL